MSNEFQCFDEAGGGHTVSFNSTSAIIARKCVAADQVSFT
jgi:hypothetical protein